MNKFQFSEIVIGAEESFKVKIDSTMMDKFLEISRDSNPIHTDSEYARKKGFVDRLVYGLLTSSFYSTLVGVYLPGKYCILHEVDVQFSSPVYIGDLLTIFGKVNYINESYRQLEIKASITNQNNKRVSKATLKTGFLDE